MSDQANDPPERDDINDVVSPTEIEGMSSAEHVDDESSEQATSAEAMPNQSSDSPIGLGDAQKRAREVAEELLEYKFEGIIKIEATDDDSWRTVVEVVERSAVPDTQDIIGCYEITLDETGSVTSYELLRRYRRGDMKEEM
ncbi:gas vesicle protein [Halogeometricum borinquense]|uniref:Gas vesicle protein n=1 Tax=Halogeometricum borinquense TaxID=60847 RepID=A0A482T6H8_9EURY|nr:gas vesicle protein [Halogeometricum borinquense]RYJ08487.1 gas vesicle protein [Halogeometricum borinquense]